MSAGELVRYRDRVAFGQSPYAASPMWTDITLPDGANDNAVRPGSGAFASGRQNRNGQFEATTVTLNAGNRDGRYTPFNNASPYYPLEGSPPYAREIEVPAGSGDWLPFWAGVLSDIGAGFEGAAAGTAALTMQQRLALPGLQPLPAFVVGQIESANPAGFWPLNDMADSETATDSRGDTYPALTLTHTGTGGDFAFGVGDAPGPDPGGTRAAFTPADDNNHYALRGTIPTAYTGEWTWAAVIAGAYQSTYFAENTLYQTLDPFSGGFTAYINSAGKLVVRVTKPFAGVVATVTSTTTVGDNTERAVGFDIHTVAGTSTIRLRVGGVLQASATFTAFTMPFAAVNVGAASWFYTSTISPYNGTLANVAHWNAYLPTLHSTYAASLTGYGTETADARLSRLAALARIAPEWITTTGTFTRQIAEQPTQGRTFADLLKELETAEIGRVYCDWSGRIGLASANAYYYPRQTITLSAINQFNLGGDFGVDPDNMVNDWTGARDGGEPQRYTADDAILDLRGMKTADAGILPLTTDDDVLSVGQWAVNTTAVPTIRFPTVQVGINNAVKSGGEAYDYADIYDADLLYDDSVLNQLVSVLEGDRVILTDLPTGSPATEFTGMVERVAKVETGDDLVVELTLSAWTDIAEYDSDDLGRYADDPGSITLNSAITDTATSVVIVTEADCPPLTNTDLPVDVSIGGERATVTAVSSASSPQTLTVTRGVAPTYPVAHDAGCVVSVWSPAIVGV